MTFSEDLISQIEEIDYRMMSAEEELCALKRLVEELGQSVIQLRLKVQDHEDEIEGWI